VDRSTNLLTPASLKALAHPVRVELLSALRLHGASTATELGRRIGESSGTTSYHLRQLAAAGFVAEDEGRGNARERWWRAAQDSTRLESNRLDDDPGTSAAVDTFLLAVGQQHSSRLHHWLRTAREWPKRWSNVTDLSDYRLSMSPAELDRLNRELESVIESYRRAPKKGDEQVLIQVQSFPIRTES